MIKIKKIIKNTIFIDILIIFLTLVYFFKPAFLDHKILAPADFLFNWQPWSSVKPINYTGPWNPVISDVSDGWIPRIEEIRHTPFLKLFDDYLQNWGWGNPNPSIVGGGGQDLLLYLTIKIFDVARGFTIYNILKTFLTGLGMYFLLHHFKLSRVSKLFGAISYMYTSPFIAALLMPHTIVNTVLPYLLIIVDKLSDQLTTKRSILYIVLVYFMITFSGFPSLIFYGLLIVEIFYIYKLFIINKNSLKTKFINLFKYLLLNLITVLIISFTLLPNIITLKSFDLTYRENYGMRRLDTSHLLQLFYPNICGNHINITWTCDSNWNETSTFSGVLPIIFILLTIFISKNIHNKKKWFFFIVTFLEISIIFNFFNILKIVSHIPILNLNPSTRLVVILPFTLIICSCFALEQLTKIKIKNFLLQILLSILTIFILLKWIAPNIYLLFIEKLLEIPKVFIDNDIHLYLKLCLIIIFISIGYFVFKKHKIKELIIILLCFIPLFELKHFNGYYNPYVSKNNFYPTTPGIEYLKEKTKPQDRSLTMEKVFMPSIPNYYHINTITGHNFRTKEFTQNMQYLDPNIFKGHGTLGFFNRASTNLSLEMRNFMLFNRIKYLVFGPSVLSPQYDVVDQQYDYNTTLILDQSYQYIYKTPTKTSVNGIMVNIVPTNTCKIIDNIQVKTLNIIKNIPIYSSSCSLGTYTASFKDVDLDQNSYLIINFSKNINNRLYVYNARDIFENGYFSKNIDNKTDISFYLYKKNKSEPYKKVYSGNDMDIYEVNSNTSTALFYPCDSQTKEECVNNIKNTKLESINKIYNKMQPIEFEIYKSGKITLNTQKISSTGILIISDNYFDGWKTPNNKYDVFKGLYGSINIYIDKIPGNNILLIYSNPYFKVGLIISSIGILLFLIYCKYIIKIKK